MIQRTRRQYFANGLFMLGIAACALLQQSQGGEPPAWKAPRLINIFRGHVPVGIAGATDFEGWMGKADVENGNPIARGVVVRAERDHNALFPLAMSDTYEARYPALREGDFVALLGEVYRVQSIGGDPQTRRASISFLRLPDPKGPPLPPRATTTKGTYAFPLGCWAGGTLDGAPFSADIATDPRADPVNRPTVKIDVAPHYSWVAVPGGKRKENRPGGSHTAHVGDIVRIGDIPRRVRNIVPPDRENHVIGWFEIDQKPERMGDASK